MEINEIKQALIPNERKLKLQPIQSPRAYQRRRTVPSLKLSGIWLEKSGFKIGETVQITIKNKELIIKAC